MVPITQPTPLAPKFRSPQFARCAGEREPPLEPRHPQSICERCAGKGEPLERRHPRNLGTRNIAEDVGSSLIEKPMVATNSPMATNETGGLSQSCRAMIKCIFGWGKQHGTMRKTKHRGITKVTTDFMLNLIAYNLIRIPKLLTA